MKVMISQPMNGVPDKEIKKIRKEIEDKFKTMHIDVVDSFITRDAPNNTYHPNLYYLGRTIMSYLSSVDAVYFVDGWEKAKGCRIEHAICQEYEIKCLYSDFFTNQPIQKITSISIGTDNILSTNQREVGKITY